LLEGQAITKFLNNAEDYFFEVAKKAPAVICCRCLPS
jgi:magnesium-transporting ATPase (P-type)